MTKCPECGQEVNLEDCGEVDYGCHEEFWGAMVWHPHIVYLTPCCGVEIEEDED